MFHDLLQLFSSSWSAPSCRIQLQSKQESRHTSHLITLEKYHLWLQGQSLWPTVSHRALAAPGLSGNRQVVASCLHFFSTAACQARSHAAAALKGPPTPWYQGHDHCRLSANVPVNAGLTDLLLAALHMNHGLIDCLAADGFSSFDTDAKHLQSDVV